VVGCVHILMAMYLYYVLSWYELLVYGKNPPVLGGYEKAKLVVLSRIICLPYSSMARACGLLVGRGIWWRAVGIGYCWISDDGGGAGLITCTCMGCMCELSTTLPPICQWTL
jgi:hypothetical protein